MNHYAFEDIALGLTESFTTTVTEEHMVIFGNLSGDYNPMHVDREYAKERGYKNRIVYGMLASSFYSALVGMYLPGERCLLNKCDVDYIKPVYIGDSLTVLGEVVDIRTATRRIRIKAKTINQEGIIVNTAEITVSFTK